MGSCHFCKDNNLAEQSNNLCIECFNAIVIHYAQQKPAQDNYLETMLIGLKPEPLQKLYIKAKYMSHLDYCQEIIKFYAYFIQFIHRIQKLARINNNNEYLMSSCL